MYQLEKMPLIWFLLNILKPNFATYDWFWADGPQMVSDKAWTRVAAAPWDRSERWPITDKVGYNSLVGTDDIHWETKFFITCDTQILYGIMKGAMGKASANA